MVYIALTSKLVVVKVGVDSLYREPRNGTEILGNWLAHNFESTKKHYIECEFSDPQPNLEQFLVVELNIIDVSFVNHYEELLSSIPRKALILINIRMSNIKT